jgi:hypothetical protein
MSVRLASGDRLLRSPVFVVEGPDGELAACRWTAMPTMAFAVVGFEAIAHGRSIGDFGLYDPRAGVFRLPARWGDRTAPLSDLKSVGADFDVEAGMIVMGGTRPFPTTFG